MRADLYLAPVTGDAHPPPQAGRLPVRDQPGLPWWTTLRLVRSGIGFRLVRSGITVSIQALAVAFLVFTIAGGRLESHIATAAGERLAPRLADRVALTRLTRPDPPAEVAAALAAGAAPDAYGVWGDLSDDSFAAIGALARELAAAEAWLGTLGPADAAAVLGGRSPAAVAARLETAEPARAFLEAVRNLPAVKAAAAPVAPERWLPLLTADRRRVAEAVTAISAGHAAAVQSLAERYPGRDLTEVVAEAPPGLRTELQAAGFDADALLAAAPEARRLADAARLTAALQEPAPRRALARELGRLPTEIDTAAALALAERPAGAQTLRDTLASAGAAAVPPAERLLDLARTRATTDAWAAAAASGSGGGGRTALLLGLSALVCVIGIGNAMLMSVTERFGEIATMKCLGARSDSILRMYLAEALLLGMVGATLGAALGLLLAVLATWAATGSLLALALPFSGSLAVAVLAAAAAGVGLSAVAAVLPSLLAARLSPMEALRVE